MTRHRTALDRALDIKPHLFALCDALLGPSPALRRATGFFPDFAWPEPDRVEVLLDRTRRHRLYDARYDAQRAIVLAHNMDASNPDRACSGEQSRTIIAEIADVVIPGHTLTPVEARTGAQISLGQSAKARWGFAHPAPIALKRIAIDAPVLSIPPVFHYGHLTTDILMPIAEARRIGALDRDEEIVVVTGRHPPLVGAFLQGLKATGIRLRQLRIGPTEHIRAARYIHARSHCPNSERIFSTPEAAETVRALFSAAYAGHPPATRARRLYLKRSNHRHRFLIGEDAMLERLRRAGFDVLEPSWENHAEQAATCAQAQVLVAAHGAAMANILLCPPGATLVELMAQNARKSTGLHWAAEVGAGYVPILCGPEREKLNFAVDPDATADAIIAAADAAQASA